MAKKEGTPDSEQKERLTVKFAALTISGKSGTGKTATEQILRERLGIPEERVYKVGQDFRKKVHTHEIGPLLRFHSRDAELDNELDNYQEALLQGSNISNPLILEGKLSGLIARKVRNETELPIATLLFVCEEETRLMRIIERERHIHPDKSGEEIRDASVSRDGKDEELWRQIYPNLLGNRPLYDPERYDFIIDTSTMTVEETAKYVIIVLEKAGYISKQRDCQ